MASLGTKQKDPDDVLDYTINWSSFLKGDTITSSNWVVDNGLSTPAASHDDSRTTIWLSGGTAGQSYTVTNTITTAGGRTLERSFTMVVLDL